MEDKVCSFDNKKCESNCNDCKTNKEHYINQEPTNVEGEELIAIKRTTLDKFIQEHPVLAATALIGGLYIFHSILQVEIVARGVRLGNLRTLYSMMKVGQYD